MAARGASAKLSCGGTRTTASGPAGAMTIRETIAYRAEKKGYHFARADWVALFYDVTKA